MASNDADLLRSLRALPTATRTRQLGQSQRRYVPPTARTNGRPFAFSSGAGTSGSREVDVARSKLNNYTNNKISEFPDSGRAFSFAQSGGTEPSGALGSIGSAIFNNPIAKIGLGALSILDTPRRAVISAVREGMDILDSDPNTDASFGDWFKQTKDVTYGFGTAFPMEGNWGRAIGFLGDVLLDPIVSPIPGMRVNFGNTFAKNVVMGVADEGGKKVLRNVAGYTRSGAGREQSAALAGIAQRLGASDELVKDIISRNKDAFRMAKHSVEGPAMATKMGLQKNGLYWLNNRIRLPLSGPIADMLETGIARARIGFLEHVPGMAKIHEVVTPGKGILGATRAKARRGALSASEAASFVKQDTVVFARRAAENMGKIYYANEAKRLFQNPEFQDGLGPDFYKFWDTNPTYIDETTGDVVQVWAREPTELEAKALEHADGFQVSRADEIDVSIGESIPGFKMNRRTRGNMPNVITEEFRQLMEEGTSARALEVQGLVTFNAADPQGSFASRTLVKGKKWFGHRLTQDDVEHGIERYNQLARNPKDNLPGLKGDAFETDPMAILSKYGDHYYHQLGTGAMLKENLKLGEMQTGKIANNLRKGWVGQGNGIVEHELGKVELSLGDARSAGAEAIDATVVQLREQLATQQALLGQTANPPSGLLSQAKAVGDKGKALVGYRKATMKLIATRNALQRDVASFSDIFMEKDALVTQAFDRFTEVDTQLNDLIGLMDSVSASIESSPANAGEVFIRQGPKEMTIDDTLTELNQRAKVLAESMDLIDSEQKHLAQVADETQLLMAQGIENKNITGNKYFNEVLTLDREPGARAKGVPGSLRGKSGHGGLTFPFLERALGPDSPYPELKRIMNEINPNLSPTFTPRNLAKIFLDNYTDKQGVLVRGIRDRIALGVTTGSNREEVRQAAAWLILRDYKVAEGLGNDFGVEMLLDTATKARHDRLVELLKEADIADAIDTQQAILTRNGARVGTLEKPLSAGELAKASESARTIEHNTQKYLMESNALENAQARLLSMTDDLEISKAKFEALPDPDPGDVNALYAFDQAREQFTFDQKNIVRQQAEVERMTALKAKTAVKVPTTQRKVVDQLHELNGGAERTTRLADMTSEYFLHSETLIQTGKKAKALHLAGFEPSPELYRHELSKVATEEREKLLVFQSKYRDAIKALERLQTRAMKPIENSMGFTIQLKESLKTLFDGTRLPGQTDAAAFKVNAELINDRALIREFFPEIEAVWRETHGSVAQSQFITHPDAPLFVKDLLDAAQSLGVQEQYIQAVTRRGGLVHFQSGGFENFSYDTGEAFKAAKGTLARTKSDAAQEAEYATKAYSDTAALMRETERMFDERMIAEGRLTRADIEARFPKKVKAGGGPATQTLGDLMPDGTRVSPRELALGQRKESTRFPIPSRHGPPQFMDELSRRFDEIQAGIKANKPLKKQALARTKAKTGAQVKGLIGGGEHYGFVAKIDKALKLGNRQVTDLFAEMLGGSKSIYSSDVVDKKSLDLVRSFKEIAPGESLTGRAMNRANLRVNQLGALSDNPIVSTEALRNGVQPGVWAFNPDLQGPSGVADALDNEAKDLVSLSKTYERRARRQAKVRGQLAVEERKLQAPMNYSDAVMRRARQANSAKALEIARNKIKPAEDQLRAMRSNDIYKNAISYQYKQQFAKELAGLSDEFVIRSGLFTPMEWHALWGDGWTKLDEFAPGMEGVKEMLNGQLDLLHKTRNEYIAGRRSVKSIDFEISKIEAAQTGLYNLDDFKAQAYEKFDAKYNELGGDDNALAELKKKVKAALDSETQATKSGLNSPYAMGDAVDSREAMLRERWDASPEGKYMARVSEQENIISEAMTDHLLREPVTDTRVAVGKAYEAGKNPQLQAKLSRLIAERERLVKAKQPFDKISAQIVKVRTQLATKTDVQRLAPGAIQNVARRPVSELTASVVDPLKVSYDKIPFQSFEAANIYSHAVDIRQQADFMRRQEISRLRAQLGRSEPLQDATTARMQSVVAEIDRLLNKTGIKLDPGAKAKDIAKRARSNARDLRRRPAQEYKAIKKTMERSITKSVIDELGYDPGMFRGQTLATSGMTKADQAELSRLTKQREKLFNQKRPYKRLDVRIKELREKQLNPRTRKLLAEAKLEPTPANLDKIFKARVAEDIAKFKLEMEYKPSRLFQLEPERAAQLAGKKALANAPIEAELESVYRDLMDLNFQKLYETNSLAKAKQLLVTLDPQRKALLAEQWKLGVELSKAKDARQVVMKAGKKLHVGNMDAIKANEAFVTARHAYGVADRFDTWGPAQIKEVQLAIAETKALIKRGESQATKLQAGKRVLSAWEKEATDFIDESLKTLDRISGGDKIDEITRNLNGQYILAKQEYLKSLHGLDVAKVDAEHEKIVAKLIRGMDPLESTSGEWAIDMNMGITQVDYQRAGMTDATIVFDEGFVELSKYFPTIGVRKEIAEIYQNVRRIQDPAFSRELHKVLGRYTKFFKAYATLSPGFHLRNAMSNVFMALASGAHPVRLLRGLKMSNAMLQAFKEGKTFEQWVVTLPKLDELIMRGTMQAGAASGGGLIDDFLSEITPIGTKHMKQVGRWIEHHSRFMLAYDGVAGGFTPQQAAARVKRFLIDYQDVSTLDASMRQIVPFWMWTSRNLPLQVTNMWLNPKAYQIFNAMKRNLRDDKEGDIVPSWMSEMGAFKLPFGNDLYATPDIGFNRVQQQINELQDPSKFLANVNPAIRIPLELASGKQFFSGREFSKNPVPVSGGLSSVLQPLLQALGYGTTGPDGTKFVSDAAYYALRNALPPVGVGERLMPSVEASKESQSWNPLLGFSGVPARQNTMEMMLGEIARRKRLVSGEASRAKSMQDAMGG